MTFLWQNEDGVWETWLSQTWDSIIYMATVDSNTIQLETGKRYFFFN